MKKKLIILSALAVVAFLASVLVTQADHRFRSRGWVEYYQDGYLFSYSLMRQTNAPHEADGWAWNYTADDKYYRMSIWCARLVSTTVGITTSATSSLLFAGPVIETNQSGWGPWVVVKVHDGGFPGSGKDHIWAQFTSRATAESMCVNGTTPSGGPFDVLEGNLWVR